MQEKVHTGIYVYIYKPCGHKVVVVVYSDEGLHLGPLLHLLLAHTTDHTARVALNTSYKGMAIGLVCGTIIVVL